MIQRIQTVYLFFALILLLWFIFSPVFEIIDKEQVFYLFYNYGFYKVESIESKKILLSSIPLLIILVVVAFLIFITIFSYKNRILQMRLCIFNMLLIIGSIFLILFYYKQASNKIQIESLQYKFSAIFPLIVFILIYLAFRSIRRDEILVQSINRLR